MSRKFFTILKETVCPTALLKSAKRKRKQGKTPIKKQCPYCFAYKATPKKPSNYLLSSNPSLKVMPAEELSYECATKTLSFVFEIKDDIAQIHSVKKNLKTASIFKDGKE